MSSDAAIVVRPGGASRVIAVIACLIVLAGAIYSFVRMGLGHWTWDGPGVALAVVFVLLALFCLVGLRMLTSSSVSFDPDAGTLSVAMLGSVQARDLDAPDTQLRVRVTSWLVGRGQEKYVVKQPGQLPLAFYATINGEPAALRALLAAAVARFPEIADEPLRNHLGR